ncbi:GIY-YIG nuclease family protein [Solemya velesiana gill symbiont]|uniref:GIY-YIG nuclease family protein n=1 Tax=Solemya velesiana gill symbiont TaxID=1918948 RepID=UPI00099878A3|nr:GIY-YIG nuclease family protein [Solemya velesiana gill symbiont]
MTSRFVPDSRSGTYVLVLYLDDTRTIEAGSMGPLVLEAGWYTYVGSAFGPGGVAARCRHHRKESLRPHWHVDYLRAVTELREIWFSHDPGRREHQWAGLLSGSRGARQPYAGFGSSDCSCVSHLFRFTRRPSFNGFRRRLRSALPGHGIIRQELIHSNAT